MCKLSKDESSYFFTSKALRPYASGFCQPSRNVPLHMKYAANINVIVVFYVENQIRKTIDRPAAQRIQLQRHRIAGKTAVRMSANVLQAGLYGCCPAKSQYRS